MNNAQVRQSGLLRLWQQIQRNRLAYWFLLPSLLVIGVIILIPLIQVVLYSFKSYYLIDVLRKGTPYIGFENYIHVLTDPEFWHSLNVTIIFTAACVVFTMLVGLGVALLLYQDFPGNKIVAVAILLPWVMPRVASSILWKWIYDEQYGILNFLLASVGLTSFASFPWLANTISALIAVTGVIVWQSFPFIAISLLAGLQSIPIEAYEAAEIDGAGFWKQLRYVTLPMLKPILGVLTIISTIWDFKIFDQMWVLTGGGPAGSTAIMGIYTWIAAFGRLQMGWASALAVIMLILVMLITVLYIKLFLREEREPIHG